MLSDYGLCPHLMRVETARQLFVAAAVCTYRQHCLPPPSEVEAWCWW